MKDGYGINDHLIEQADEAGIDTIITCDNGIAAIGEIAHAKSLGMTVLVTDHHEIPYTEERGERHYKRRWSVHIRIKISAVLQLPGK